MTLKETFCVSNKTPKAPDQASFSNAMGVRTCPVGYKVQHPAKMTSSLVCRWLSQDHFLGVGALLYRSHRSSGLKQIQKHTLTFYLNPELNKYIFQLFFLDHSQLLPVISLGSIIFGGGRSLGSRPSAVSASMKIQRNLKCVHIATL